MAARDPKMADGVWKGVQPKVIGHFKQLSPNKFFDLSTPSMRKGDGGEKNGGKNGKRKKKKITAEIVATNVVASQPPNGDQLFYLFIQSIIQDLTNN